ncbi:tape measure protein, partial [Parabacteroides merdae]|uniref:tape measure protein n=1 Tax=Parabacteroides merdae TaxID=46503 RepID=UPI0039B6D04F
MPKLAFHIEADYQKVIKLREEIDKLKSTISGMDGNTSPATFRAMEAQLAKNTKELDSLVVSAVRAGNEINQGFKKKIFDASQVVNGFSEKIIAQKSVIKGIEADVKRLGEAYRIALKRNPLSANKKLEEYNAVRKALDEEKAVLFDLTQQQAGARLSVKKLRDEYALYKDDAKEVVDSNNGIAISWKKVLAVIGGVGVLKALGSEIIRVRGEFQAADTAIQTLLGSKEKADALMSQVREYAKISPLEFSDVTQATQMMLGFNIEAEKVPRYLQAIGDVSMGDTQRFNSLTLAFSQMSAAGKLMGQDLNQMINAGFNPLQIMADKTGKSIATLKDEMSKGAISAEMVQQAFIDATSAGGKFYNMSENASKTINGQLSMMQDAMDSVFNELGQKSEGVIIKGIQTTTSLIENYETIGKVLAGLAATYGVYRTALIASITLTRSWAVAARVDAAAKGIQTIMTKAQTVAQLALNAAMKANPYVLLATIVASFTATMWVLHDSTTAVEKAQKQLSKEQEEAAHRKQELTSKTDSLISKINSETESVLYTCSNLQSSFLIHPRHYEQLLH